MTITAQEIVDLAKEVEKGNPIDWESVDMEKDAVYNVIASSILEQVNTVMQKSDNNVDACLVTMIAAVIQLTVENFVLNTKLLKSETVV